MRVGCAGDYQDERSLWEKAVRGCPNWSTRDRGKLRAIAASVPSRSRGRRVTYSLSK